jgi:peptidase S24-like protein
LPVGTSFFRFRVNAAVMSDSVSVQPNRFEEITTELLARGLCVRFRAAGASMRPSIADGDIVTVAPLRANLAPGAIAVYRSGERLVAHRLVTVAAGADGAPVLTFRGDAATHCDAPVAPRQILGEVIDVERGPGLGALAGRARRAARTMMPLYARARGVFLAVARR